MSYISINVLHKYKCLTEVQMSNDTIRVMAFHVNRSDNILFSDYVINKYLFANHPWMSEAYFKTVFDKAF